MHTISVAMPARAYPTSPPRSFAPRRRRQSSSDSYHSCDTSSFQYSRSPTSPLFQTPPSSFAHLQNYFAPALPPRVLSPLQNCSQSSLGHSSSNHSSSAHSRYPEPYSSNPFLPLKDLRSLRSNEALRSPPLRPSTAPSSTHVTSPRQAARKLPPPISGASQGSKPVTRKALDDRDPEVEQPAHTVTESVARPSISEAFADVSGSESESSHARTAASDLGPLSPLFNPSSLGDASAFYGGGGASQQSSASLKHSASIATRSIAERRAAPSSNVGSTLRLAFGARVREVGSRGVSVCESPGASQVQGSAWDAQEQDVQMDAYGGIQEPQLVGNSHHSADVDEIRAGACAYLFSDRVWWWLKRFVASDPDKTPTNEPTLSPWARGAVAALPGRRRPPPIYVGSQVQRSTEKKMPVVNVQTHLESRPNEETTELKKSTQCGSSTDISSGTEGEESSSREQSDASQFSAFTLPPVSTKSTVAHIFLLMV